ncbi:unnamed protein product [Effrenium voratum]|nr:unnamed protein product [Effrenium voratum]
MQRLRNNVKAVVLHLEGAVGPASMHSQALTSGNFLVGLRAISIPIVSAAYGKITGPSWNLLLACDYRIAAVDTSFVLPIVSPPECLGELVGAAMASQLCISSGVLDAHSLQELGILNQVRPNKERGGQEKGGEGEVWALEVGGVDLGGEFGSVFCTGIPRLLNLDAQAGTADFQVLFAWFSPILMRSNTVLVLQGCLTSHAKEQTARHIQCGADSKP